LTNNADRTVHVDKNSKSQYVCGDEPSKNALKNILIELRGFDQDMRVTKSITFKN
jgi:hypothetical protein